MSSKLNTTAIREMAAAHANEKRRRKEPPGAVLTGTAPGLCDEVDRLRAIVARVVSVCRTTDGEWLDGDAEIPVGEVVRMLYPDGVLPEMTA